MHLTTIKGIYAKFTANILNGEKLKDFTLTLGTRQGYLVSSLLFKIELEVLSEKLCDKRNRQPNRNGRNKILCFQIAQSS
jgi:hypothetical protein